MICNISTVKLNFSGSEIKPGALIYINHGAPNTPKMVNPIKNNPSNVATLFINKAVSIDVLFDLYSERIGTKA